MSETHDGLNRRTLLVGVGASAAVVAGCVPEGTTLTSAALGYKAVPQLGDPSTEPFKMPTVDMTKIPTEFHRQYVKHTGRYKKNTLVVDTANRHLYLIGDEDDAIRYGIGVGRAGFAWGGRANIRRKAQWPTWTPPSRMIKREPHLKKWAGGMPGGPSNPLGARALYLYRGGRDTLYRLHGTNDPSSIGKAMSSGCIRMLNKDAIDLYERVPIGSVVVVNHGSAAV